MRRLIRTDGSIQDFAEPVTMAEIRRLIHADVTDAVILHHMGAPVHVMNCDDGAWETETINHGGGRYELRPVLALKPINREATRLYHLNCKPGVTQEIAGDVFICPDLDFMREGGL